MNEHSPRFATKRDSASRAAVPWRRYSYHLAILRSAIADLSYELRLPAGARVLDFGSGESPYRSFFGSDIDYLAVDLPGNPDATLTLTATGEIPTDNESVDAVLSTQVLEHVDDPGLYLSEAFRVLRPGGRMLLTTHGSFVWHPDPCDYWRWTGQGLQRAVTAAGFEVVHFRGLVGLLPTAIQLALDGVYWRLPRLVRAPATAVAETLMRLTDRLHSDWDRAHDAQTFALIALRP